LAYAIEQMVLLAKDNGVQSSSFGVDVYASLDPIGSSGDPLEPSSYFFHATKLDSGATLNANGDLTFANDLLNPNLFENVTPAFDEVATITAVTGAATTDRFTKTGNGLSKNDLVLLRNLSGGTGLAEETPYYVVGVAGDDFQLSLTSGGPAINFTTDVTDVTLAKLALNGVYTSLKSPLNLSTTFEIPIPDGINEFTLSSVVRVGSTVAAPEPSTFALLGVALAGLGFTRRRKLH
jgi:hypothetical protein